MSTVAMSPSVRRVAGLDSNSLQRPSSRRAVSSGFTGSRVGPAPNTPFAESFSRGAGSLKVVDSPRKFAGHTRGSGTAPADHDVITMHLSQPSTPEVSAGRRHLRSDSRPHPNLGDIGGASLRSSSRNNGKRIVPQQEHAETATSKRIVRSSSALSTHGVLSNDGSVERARSGKVVNQSRTASVGMSGIMRHDTNPGVSAARPNVNMRQKNDQTFRFTDKPTSGAMAGGKAHVGKASETLVGVMSPTRVAARKPYTVAAPFATDD